MTISTLTFDAVQESSPGPKWRARWERSWPAYKKWFIARCGDQGPSRAECEMALGKYMPELLPVHARLCELAGNGDRAARFLSTWCPPRYLGGCSLACVAQGDDARLVRNYDLSPDLNEGLLFHSNWTGTRVMGMVEFLWGLSDGINEDGLAVALAYGGRSEVATGFGITTILRYVLETCATVNDAIDVLRRVPSHMAYNIALADSSGATAAVEVQPGGGIRLRKRAAATNHQKGKPADRATFTRTKQRMVQLKRILAGGIKPEKLAARFLDKPLYQTRYQEGFGTLFTAEYLPAKGSMRVLWPNHVWEQSLSDFREGTHIADYGRVYPAHAASTSPPPFDPGELISQLTPLLPERFGRSLQKWRAASGSDTAGEDMDWAAFGQAFYR